MSSDSRIDTQRDDPRDTEKREDAITNNMRNSAGPKKAYPTREYSNLRAVAYQQPVGGYSLFE
jgi:hypothetical protein